MTAPRHPGRRIGSALLVAALALAGCAVGPGFHPPTPPAAGAATFVSTAGAGAVNAPLPEAWWRLYRDPVLDGLVGEALTANQDLRIAAANLAYAQALVDEAGAGRFPGTTVSAGGAYQRGASQAAARLGPSTLFSAGLTAAYQVDLFGRISRAIQAADANAQASLAAEDVVRVTVAARTASAYANVCGYGEQLAVARRSVALVQQAYDLTVAQRDAGALSDFDVDRESVILQQARAAVPPLAGQRRAALFTLAALVGRPPAEIPGGAAGCETPPKLDQAIPVGDGAALLRRRPDVRQAERLFAAATARIGVATADLYPTITLGGGVSNAAPSLAGLGAGATGAFSLGPLLSWSFPNVLVARAHVKQAGAQADGALAGFDKTVLEALRDVEQALAIYGSELDHHAALAAARDSADAALRLADLQYQAGVLNFLDLITAQSSVVSASQALALSDQVISTDQVAVFQALGGGWEHAPPVKTTPPPHGS